MTAPLIDILLATYNGARYLAPQLDSLLGQTHQHFRLLVSDDGSTDATLDILRGYRAAFGERLILLPNPSPGAGVVRNFERLMQASLADGQAQWAASCDQDDVWLPDKLATQWAEMQRIEVQAGTQTPCLVHGDLTDDNLMRSISRDLVEDPERYEAQAIAAGTPPNVARQAKVDVAVSNGFGFGGTNGTLVFRRI